MSATPSNSLRGSLPPGPMYREGYNVPERGRRSIGGSDLTTLLVVGAAGAVLAGLAWYYLGPDLIRYMKIRNMWRRMHELSIALSILDLAAEEAERHGGGRVVAVHLRLGAFSGVVADALRSSYDLAREGTALDGAELVVEDVPVVAYCPACNAERAPPSAFELCCPVCAAPMPQVLRGRELEVFAIEMES